MNNPDMPAMPLTGDAYIDLNGTSHCEGAIQDGMGLTKREHFAGLVMQGLVGLKGSDCSDSDITAKQCVRMADALLKELAA